MQRLYEKVCKKTEEALAVKALIHIDTDKTIVKECGINFVVRSVLNNELRRKELASSLDFNPFLPYDTKLFVEDISYTHVVLLNKFSVIENHLLIVTKEFEDQENFLNRDDFKAVLNVMGEIDGTFFYNSGKIAGASQKHKHIQLIPALGVDDNLPIFTLLNSAEYASGIGTLSSLPFEHYIIKFEKRLDRGDLEVICGSYKRALNEAAILNRDQSYNLLINHDFLYLIPRSSESYGAISINALGFAGSFLVKDSKQMEIVKELGPLKILEKSGVSRNI